MVAPSGNQDQVRYDILIEAKQAIQALREIGFTTADNSKKIQIFTDLIQAQSKVWGVSIQQALNVYKQLNAELSKAKRPTIFGQTGGQNLMQQSEQYLQALEQAGRMQTQVGNSATEMGNKTEKATSRMARGIDVVRIALGVLVSMLIFQVMQAISNAFRMFVANVRETELAIYNLINAERRLSEEGIDVTPKGLQETIDSVRELVPVLSQIQAEELVSRIATNVAPSLKLTNEQIKQMAEATALLYIRNKALGKSFEEVEAQITNAFLTGKVSVGINQLGVKISDQIVKDEALRLGLVKTEEQFNSLTGEVESQIKAAAMLSVVYKNATGDVESIGDYMETTDAQIERAKTAWSDLLTVAGQAFGPMVAQGMEMIAHALEVIIKLLEAGMPVLQLWTAGLVGLADTMRNMPQYFKPGGGMDFFQNFKDNFKKVMDSFKDFETMADTPTSAVEGLQDTIDDFDGEEFSQKIEDILEDAQNARDDLEEKLGQKREDIDLEYQRKALDAERDYNRKVEDINRDAEREIAALKEEQRQEDLRAEEDYQLKLWELRMRFLMDLEEALHARDARQVIRLQKQYEIDKEALLRKKGLDDKQREEDQRDQLEDIELKRQQRLEDAQREYEEKLYDQRLAKQRELDDLNVWYQREQDDLEKSIQRKLQALIDGYIDEKKITEQNAAEVYGILYKYFGPGGLTDALYQYMASKMAMASAIPSLTTGYSLGGGLATSSTSSTGGTTGGRTPTTSAPRRHGGEQMAEGGTLIASRPTTVTFGEAGLEMAQFTPLSRLGKDVNKVFGSMGNNGINGQIAVELFLSPDLEARVINASLDGVAEIVTKVNRSKL